MIDQFGRSIEYLRISVTDRCNFRCVYCMPERGLDWIPRDDILSASEIHEVVSQLAPLGLRRIRITGGEPTLRRDVCDIVSRIASVDGVTDIALSTNGVRLEAMGTELRAAGITRVNISVDSLRPDRIAAIARRDLKFEPVRVLRAAIDAGFDPIKVNTVVVRGVNDDEIASLARLTLDLPVHVRFIELMPVGDMSDSGLERVVPSDEVLAAVDDALGGILPDIGPALGNGPARYYRAPGGLGTIGVITPISHTYCASCNRVRLTADGRLRTCLFGDHEVDLRTPLRAGIPLASFVARALEEKPREHALLQLRTGGLRALSQTGG
ncbi:MAG TPA: GTP 3',8-cyclase MoaA [Gemmatimonadaceae bacterium]|nr:GTP 3',8-cyclase MoaA [Gemmatimonadaceae bacterium]